MIPPPEACTVNFLRQYFLPYHNKVECKKFYEIASRGMRYKFFMSIIFVVSHIPPSLIFAGKTGT
jgi:hypothetical protein